MVYELVIQMLKFYCFDVENNGWTMQNLAHVITTELAGSGKVFIWVMSHKLMSQCLKSLVTQLFV